MKRLLRYMANFKFHLLLALVLAISSNLLALVGPSLSGKAVDAIAPGKGKVDFGEGVEGAWGRKCGQLCLVFCLLITNDSFEST